MVGVLYCIIFVMLIAKYLLLNLILSKYQLMHLIDYVFLLVLVTYFCLKGSIKLLLYSKIVDLGGLGI